MNTTLTTPDVYQAIAKITGEMSKEGISKDRKNQQQGYSFRGIDDVYAAIAPKLAAHGLCILPRVMSREVIERTNAKGNVLFYTTLTVEFDFVSSVDGSKHTVCTIGEAMDSGDKSANKAMSAAYKYAAFQTFCIPTEGDNDADSTTHNVAPKQPAKTEPKTHPAKKELTPAMKDVWDRAKESYKKEKNLNAVKAHFSISEDNEKRLITECQPVDTSTGEIAETEQDVPQ